MNISIMLLHILTCLDCLGIELGVFKLSHFQIAGHGKRIFISVIVNFSSHAIQ